ncbi:hypothetical protein, partial [Agrobacterium vitis]|uniref:hypothetical protein n=1 Tax=Agrobacterium vitis TaxID=373 RepID=UPI001AEDC58B
SRSTTNADKATITNISNHRPDTVPGQVINLSVIMRSVYVQEPSKTAPATKHCAFYSAGHKVAFCHRSCPTSCSTSLICGWRRNT